LFDFLYFLKENKRKNYAAQGNNNFFFMENRNGTQVIIKKNRDIHVPTPEGQVIDAAQMTLAWSSHPTPL
jgi:hypothetical protein